MSLVSCLFNYGNPIVITDLSLSSDVDAMPVIIPSLNKAYHPSDFPGKSRPSSFGLKQLIIKDVLCIAVAGDVDEIFKLLNAAGDFYLNREISVANTNLFIDQYDLFTFTNCAVFIHAKTIVQKDEAPVRYVGKCS